MRKITHKIKIQLRRMRMPRSIKQNAVSDRMPACAQVSKTYQKLGHEHPESDVITLHGLVIDELCHIKLIYRMIRSSQHSLLQLGSLQ